MTNAASFRLVRAALTAVLLVGFSTGLALAQPGVLVIRKDKSTASAPATEKTTATETQTRSHCNEEEWSPTWSGRRRQAVKEEWRARPSERKSPFRYASQSRQVTPQTSFRSESRKAVTKITAESASDGSEHTLPAQVSFSPESPNYLPESIVPQRPLSNDPFQPSETETTTADSGWQLTPFASSVTSNLDNHEVESCQPGCLDECGTQLSFREGLRELPSFVWDDAKNVFGNKDNLLLFGLATGAAIAVHQNLDGEVRLRTSRHSPRLNSGVDTLGEFGDVPIQIPALLGTYAYSVWAQNEEVNHLSKTLISAYTITGVSTVILKGIVDSDRPTNDWNDGRYGFPSFHTASSFTIAAVLDEYYGAKVGLPAYTFAGLIGYSRIDERDHDLSDVLFGAALGYIVGKSVAGKHLHGDSRVRILPYVHPTEGSTGVMLECPF